MSNIELWPEQALIVDRFKNETEGALLLEMGVGKTAIAINILKHHINNLDNPSERILVVCPSIVIKNWDKEIKRFFIENKYPVLASTKDGKKRLDELDAFSKAHKQSIVIVNYEVATSSMGPLVEAYRPDTLIIDESHKVKNPKSKMSKYFFRLRKQAKKCFILTGTVIANSIEDVFQQFLIMDLGESFGTNFHVFRRIYMIDLNAGFVGSHNYFPKYVPNPKMLLQFKEIMLQKSVVMKTSDMVDLPELEVQTYFVKLNKEQAFHYRNLKKLMVTEIKSEMMIVDHALTKLLRLVQITSGHLPDSEGKPIVFKDLEKVKLLQTLVSDMMSRSEKVIIWTCFRADVDIVTKAMKEIGQHDLLYITGAQSTDQKAESEWEFTNSARFKIIICNLASASTGVNLQKAKHAVFYSRNFSFIHNVQAMARNYRGGSIDLHDKVLIHNIVTQDTVEEDVIDALEKKRQLSGYILDNLESQNMEDKSFKRDVLDKFLEGDD